MSIESLLESLRADSTFTAHLSDWATVDGQAARTAPEPALLDARIGATLRARGIAQLYSHQAEAIALGLAKRDTVVVTPTASGKTLCFNVPVLQQLLADPHARALYLYPTKALAQDQVAELSELVRALKADIRTYTYDGDTPGDARRMLRDNGHVVVTNPYMLHGGILPNHPKWTQLFQNLRYVVIDELHTYRGVFGSHMANVIRRLRRICRHYGSDPVFLCTSATIGNPRELAEKLLGREVAIVDDSGAPRGERHFLFYNPPIVHAELGLRASAVEEVRRVLRRILAFDVQVIVFARSRNMVEVLTKYAKDAAAALGLDTESVCGYRGGYLPKTRRRIEQGLRHGRIRCVVATNALELGVDIGALDVAILAGYPGSVASFYQQAGRAGRRLKPSLTIMVGRSTPMDQYLLRHTDYLLDGKAEWAVIDPNNLLIKVNHIKCSAFEVPFGPQEHYFSDTPLTPDPAAPSITALPGVAHSDETTQVLDYLTTEAKILHKANGSYYWAAEAYPAEGVSLTATDVDNFVVYDVEQRRIMAEVDRPSAMTEIYQGAIYGWQGEQYIIEALDYHNRRANARRVDCEYFTLAELERSIRALEVDVVEAQPAFELRFGTVEVTTQARIYKKVKFYTRENIGAGEINLPPELVDTPACWFALEIATAARHGLLSTHGGALLALRNLIKHVVPLFIRCDARDVHVWSETRAPAWGDRPTIYVFEHMPGGTGLAERLFAQHAEVLAAMRSVLDECPCSNGCPGCAGVELEIGPGSKRVAAAVLDDMLNSEPALHLATGCV